jgi:hypothetical protein
MIGCLLWLVATASMFLIGDALVPLVLAMVIGGALAAVRSSALSERLTVLTEKYVDIYGPPPMTGGAEGTRYGAATGAVLGHYRIGAVLGAALDIYRESRNRAGMTSEQRRLFDELSATRATSPWGGWVSLTMMLLLSTGVRWLLSS